VAPEIAALLRYLERGTPDDWYQVAWAWNWDNGVEPLRWIVAQPQCDRGTALLVYWHADPRYVQRYAERAEVPAHHRPVYDLVKDIERRYLAGGYTRQRIAFDPRADAGHDWTKGQRGSPVARPLPAMMLEPSPGARVAAARFEEGFPREVLAEIGRDEAR
jgi:hypothetical protein